jgi:hypothetical protein
MLTVYGIFLALHGLVHFWPATLSWRLVEFQPEMGWTGASFVLSRILSETAVLKLAGVLFPLAGVLFVISGIGVGLRYDACVWSRRRTSSSMSRISALAARSMRAFSIGGPISTFPA